MCVVGAGRWARVIVDVLHEILPKRSVIKIVSSHHAAVMREWASKFADARDVSVYSDYSAATTCTAAIVANAAAAHADAAERLVRDRVPTLVEKPFSLTSADTKTVIDLAAERGTYLAASHVFLFAEYVHRFADLVNEIGGPALVRFEWKDPATEVRYGERKTVDASVPVYLDVSPHVLSILRTVLPGKRVTVEKVSAERPDAAIISLTLDDIPCVLDLARNSSSRVRLLQVQGHAQSAALSFATEPGTITIDGESRVGDPDWQTRPSPLRLQLKAFLAAVNGGQPDSRLSPAIAYEASLVTDEITAKIERSA